MHFKSYSLCLLAAICAGSYAKAQETEQLTIIDPETGTEIVVTDPELIDQYNLIDNTEVFYFGDPNQTVNEQNKASLIKQFYEDQFRHSQDPQAPYFMLMSRDSKLAMGVGGDIRIIGSYDFDGSQKGPGFAPYDIPIPKDISSDNFTQITPNHTGLFVTVFGNDSRFGKFKVYVHAKFAGPGNTFKLDRAYATVNDWTFGYAKSSFDDPIAQPATVETDGPNSEIDLTKMLVRYMHDIDNKFTFALSVEDPNVNIASTNYYRPKTSNIPDVAAFLQYAYAQQHIRLSAVVKNMGYTDLVKMDNHNVTGWGVNLSMKLRPVDPLTIYASFNTGQGIGNFVNDLSLGDNDLIGYTNDLGKMYAPKSYGWYAALQYNYRPNIFSTVMFSQERLLLKEHSDYGANEYKYGLYGTANLFWKIVPRLQVGAEFNVGKRCNIDGTNRLGYRASLMAQYSF